MFFVEISHLPETSEGNSSGVACERDRHPRSEPRTLGECMTVLSDTRVSLQIRWPIFLFAFQG